MKQRELYKITAYHCSHCGAPTDPNKELCDWCAQKALLKNFRQKQMFSKSIVRVLVETGGNYINFDQIISISDISSEPEKIEVTTLEDIMSGEQKFIYGRRSIDNWSFTMPVTKRSYELSNKLEREKNYNIRIEALEADMAFEYSAEYINQTIPIAKKNELIKFDLNFIPKDIKGIIKTLVPPNMTCPNCGAPIKSRLGACDFCGGWIEFEF